MLLVVILCVILCIYFMEKNYRKSTYYQLTKNHILTVKWNKGRYGEYLTSKIIEKHASKSHRQLVNMYIPKRNSDELTEIDLLYIDRTGLYVLESKNYSGWIFGNEAHQQWTQTMPKNKRKYKFFNPIRQNAIHTRAIQDFLKLPNKAIHSVIVFGGSCTLKKVELIHVLKREELKHFIQARQKSASPIFSKGDIQAIYNRLLPQMQISKAMKKKHIRTIQQRYGKS